MGFRWAGWLGLLIAAVGLAPDVAPADATFPGANGKIAFVRYIEGGSHIFVMNADGSGVTRLTESPGYDSSPAWSPDGARIAFTRVPVEGINTGPGAIYGPQDIYIMNADGSGLINLTNDPAGDWDPAWSPDGTQIAFSSYRAADWVPGSAEIFVMASDGTHIRQLTHDPGPDRGGGYGSGSPAWSPDGAQIVFVRGSMTGSGDICVAGVDGEGELNISMDPEFDMAPDWSPDGSQIIFQHQGEGGSRIYLMNPDGSDIRRLPTEPDFEPEPVWSPDGTMIAFVVGGPPASTPGIWVMRADGTGRKPLSDGSEGDLHPAWQPLPQVASAPSSLPPSDTVRVPDLLPGTRCIPVPIGQAPTKPADEIPVVGGSPGANDVNTYRQAALVLSGLILIAASFVALRVGRRL